MNSPKSADNTQNSPQIEDFNTKSSAEKSIKNVSRNILESATKGKEIDETSTEIKSSKLKRRRVK